MLVLCKTDGDLRSVQPMVTAVPVHDIAGGFGFEVGGGRVDEHHVEADIVFFFEDMKEVAEDLVFVFPEESSVIMYETRPVTRPLSRWPQCFRPSRSGGRWRSSKMVVTV